MKKLLLLGLLALPFSGQEKAIASDGPRKVSSVRKPYVPAHERMNRLALREQNTLAATGRVQSSQQRSTPGQASVNSVSLIDLGRSVNPFTALGAGRNYVSVIPSLNMAALFRRGGFGNSGGASNRPGNKIFADVSTRGGNDGSWRNGSQFLFSDDLYNTRADYLIPAARNYAPRYPQGVLWNPPGNTDTNEVVAFTLTRVLDGTNGSWGGMGTGSARLGNISGTRKQALWSSLDPEYFHFRNESMEVTADGSVFAVGPEESLEGDVVTFTDKILVYKYTYNNTTQKFDSSITALPFENEGGEYATLLSNCAISFGQDGQTGYIVLSAANNAYDSTATYLPYISKTTNGGQTWSPWKLIPINKRWNEGPAEKDAFRDSLLLGTWVRFGSEGPVQFGAETFISPTTADDPTRHRVDYLVNDIDLTVDKDNYAHIFASLCVSGFGDTLNQTFPVGVQYFPGFGSWNVHMTISDMDSAARGTVLNQNVTLNGKWGDLDNDQENFVEANRGQISRSADGSVISFVYYDTDTAAFPPQTTDDNSNPDMWTRSLRVAGPGQYFLTDRSLNRTKGSEGSGKVVCGSVAPVMLNTPTGHKVASTYLSLSVYNPDSTTAIWSSTHVYVEGVNVPAAAQADSFPVAVANAPRITRSAPRLFGSKPAVQEGLWVYPNPVSDVVLASVKSEKGGLAEFAILNTLGQEMRRFSRVLEAGTGTQSFRAADLAPGSYTLRVQTGEGVRVSRFVVR